MPATHTFIQAYLVLLILSPSTVLVLILGPEELQNGRGVRRVHANRAGVGVPRVVGVLPPREEHVEVGAAGTAGGEPVLREVRLEVVQELDEDLALRLRTAAR